MDVLQGKIVLRQLQAAADLLRQEFPLHISRRQRLGDSLGDGLIPQALGLTVDGLHGAGHLLVGGQGKYLRLLHQQAAIFLHHPPPEHITAPRLQHGAQEGHVVPCELQAAGGVLQGGHRHGDPGKAADVAVLFQNSLHRRRGVGL